MTGEQPTFSLTLTPDYAGRYIIDTDVNFDDPEDGKKMHSRVDAALYNSGVQHKRLFDTWRVAITIPMTHDVAWNLAKLLLSLHALTDDGVILQVKLRPGQPDPLLRGPSVAMSVDVLQRDLRKLLRLL